MIIAVDFDNTMVHESVTGRPQEIPGAVLWVKRWIGAGASVYLWTCRMGGGLEEAVEWCEENGIELAGVNRQAGAEDGPHGYPKIVADIYVDDRAFGCPLRFLGYKGDAVVDWGIVGPEIYVLLTGLEA